MRLACLVVPLVVPLLAALVVRRVLPRVALHSSMQCALSCGLREPGIHRFGGLQTQRIPGARIERLPH